MALPRSLSMIVVVMRRTLYTQDAAQRDLWVRQLQFASRPIWLGVDDKGTGMPTVEEAGGTAATGKPTDDPRYKKCCVCGAGFGINSRKAHCRRCGGCMCNKKV